MTMSTDAVAETARRAHEDFPQQIKSPFVAKRLFIVLICFSFIFSLLSVTQISLLYQIYNYYLGRVVAAASSLGLAALPVVISLVHETSRERQISKLDILKDWPVSESYYFRAARALIANTKVASLEAGYFLPIVTLYFVVFSFSSILMFSPWFDDFFSQKSFVLGGTAVIGMTDNTQVAIFQKGTFLCGVAAFLGSYVYMIGRLWNRINNSDIYPTSYHYYTARMIIAYFVAVVFRHSLASFGVTGDSLIILIGFVIGLTPDFFTLTMARKVYRLIKIYGSKPDPVEQNQAAGMPLLMLDDLSQDKVDRFSELGIDNAQMLACQNPFVIWPRLPYDLGLLIDWMAQAQLYVLVREQGLKSAREKCIFDIFDLYLRLGDAQARKEVCNALQISEETAPVIVSQLDEDQSFTRLKQVRDALRVSPTSG
jgi:hypothetical protein